MIGVLIVDDEAFTLELHRSYVARLPGFRVVAEASGARAAVAALARAHDASDASIPGIDLMLLDMTMPDGSGLDVLRHARAMASRVDVIALTGVRDAETVRQVVALGAVQYLVKPFTFATFRERMEQYLEYRAKAQAAAGSATQAEIDAMLGALRPSGTTPLPKGLSEESLTRVIDVVRARESVTTAEAAELAGMSRVTTRRYLEHLAAEQRVERLARYGTGGRPTSEYRWRK